MYHKVNKNHCDAVAIGKIPLENVKHQYPFETQDVITALHMALGKVTEWGCCQSGHLTKSEDKLQRINNNIRE